MPQNLVDDNTTYPSPVAVPLGGEPRTAASVKTPFQTVANRAAYLKRVFEELISGVSTAPHLKAALLDVTGAATFAGPTALHGTTHQADGELIANIEHFQIYATDGASIASDTDIFLQASTIVLQGGVQTQGDTQLGNADTQTISVVGLLDVQHDAQFPEYKNVTLRGTTKIDGTSSGFLECVNGGIIIPQTVVHDPFTAGITLYGTSGFEHILPDNPSLSYGIMLSVAGSGRGVRVRFNATKVVTGVQEYVVGIGDSRQWRMRNQNGKTVMIEFVSDGVQWIVSQWEEGGSSVRFG